LTAFPAPERTASPRDGELSDTLAWMDNTYNRHDGALGALGHGRMGWYDSNSNGQADEYLVFGSTETFTHDGCQMGLHIQGDPYAVASREAWHASVRTFNLRDINPQSIKVSTYSHRGGLRCDDYDPEERQRYSMNCDHAVIAFSTHSEAPLIDEESHTTFAMEINRLGLVVGDSCNYSIRRRGMARSLPAARSDFGRDRFRRSCS
jgi:hypothetical protein